MEVMQQLFLGGESSTLNRFHNFFSVFAVDFEQVDAHWVVLSIFLLLLFAFVTCNVWFNSLRLTVAEIWLWLDRLAVRFLLRYFGYQSFYNFYIVFYNEKL